MKNIKLWYLLLSAIFYFTVTIQGMELLAYFLFYGVPFVYICINWKYIEKIVNVSMKTAIKYFIVFYSLLVIGALILPVFHKTFDFSYFTGRIISLPKEFIRVLFLIIVFFKHISPEGDYKLFIKYYLLSLCCYVLFTVFLLAFPQVKMLLYNIIKESAHSKEVALQSDYITRYSWAGFSGFGHTIHCTWGVCLTLFLILDNVKQKNYDLYIICAILLLGNMFYGRSGLLVSLCLLFIFVMILLKKRTKFFVAIVVLGCVGIIGLTALAAFNEQVRTWFGWAFALFINFFKTGRLETTSSNIVFEKMIFLPEFKTFLIGDARYSVGELYYMNTDVGFMRPMLFGGIFFLVIRYCCVLSLFWAFAKRKNLCTKLARNFIIMAALIILIGFEIKGEVVFTCINITLGIIILANYNLNNRKKETMEERIK